MAVHGNMRHFAAEGSRYESVPVSSSSVGRVKVERQFIGPVHTGGQYSNTTVDVRGPVSAGGHARNVTADEGSDCSDFDFSGVRIGADGELTFDELPYSNGPFAPRIMKLVQSFENGPCRCGIEYGTMTNGVFARIGYHYVQHNTSLADYFEWWRYTAPGVAVRVLDNLSGIFDDHDYRVVIRPLGVGGKRPKKKAPGKKKEAPGRRNAQLSQRVFAPVLDVAVMPHQKKKSQKKKGQGRSGSGVTMGKCALKFAMSIVDPFNPRVRGVCSPYGGTPSQKIHGFSRFDMTVGINGFAVLLFTPTISSDLPNVYYTLGTYTGTSTTTIKPWDSNGASGVNAGLSAQWAFSTHGGPHLAANLYNTHTSGKIVSCGMRIQYTGKLTDEAGTIVCYHPPTHANLTGISQSNLLIYEGVEVRSNNREPCLLSVFPVDANEFAFSGETVPNTFGSTLKTSTLYPLCNGSCEWQDPYGGTSNSEVHWAPAGTSAGTYRMGIPSGYIVINATPGSTFHVEVINHLEFVGRQADYALTDTGSEPSNCLKVVAAAKEVPRAKMADPKRSLWSCLMSELKEVWTEVKPVVVPMALEAAMALL